VSDRGSAVVDFALVGGLLTVVFLSVVQLGLVLHVRNTLTDCAFEGARYGARADRTPADGVARATDLVAAELSTGYAARLSAVGAREVEVGETRAVEVRLRAPLPVLGLLGPRGTLTVTGHAFAEQQ
jgi:Flp pilus assembly protein TadG